MRTLYLPLLMVLAACGSSDDPSASGDETGAGVGGDVALVGSGGNGGNVSAAAGSDSTGGQSGTGGSTATAGKSGSAGTGGFAGAGGKSAAGGTGGSADGGGSAGAIADAGPRAPDPCIVSGTCPAGTWTNVTPSAMKAANLSFGPGCIVGDPARASDVYITSGGAGLWKSTDYGNTWTQINKTIPYSPIGCPLAVIGTTPATVLASDGGGHGVLFKSTDGGSTFTKTGGGQIADLYSMKVDPNTSTHLISGLHEADGIVESTDSGNTWNTVGRQGWPSGGISWFPSFVDTGNAATTSKTWFAIAQDGASPIMTSDQGAHWTVPSGLNGLQHPHGESSLSQVGSSLFVAGIYGPGQGVYRSADLGVHWSRVDTQGSMPEGLVWGTPKAEYAMWGWACGGCNLGTNYETALQPGTTWTKDTVPSDLVIGPNSIVVVNDGTHYIFVGVMWAQGVWRFIEP